MGWFFDFKLHLICNEKGELLNFMITPGDVDDRKPLDTVSLSVSERSFKKRDPSLWTSPEKFVVLGDQT